MCVQPLDGWLSREKSKHGRRTVVFNRALAYSDMPVRVPCGSCVECISARAAEWASRIMHEAAMWQDSWFVTLTYADDQVPAGGGLCKADLQRFFKRLRKDAEFRYFGVGEYGTRTSRPHYHLCLFGPDFPDKVAHTVRSGHQVWTSAYLERKWQKGLCEFGVLKPESAGYVARYLTKRSTEVIDKPQEFAVMSRRPGIGRPWYEKYRCEVYAADSVVHRGKEVRVPKYYDRLEKERNPEGMREIVKRRVEGVEEGEERGSRWLARKEVGEAKVNLFKREPE